MILKTVALKTLLLVTLLNLSFGGTGFAQTATLSHEANRIKLKIIRLDTGKTIKVRLKDKSKVKGKITEINDDHFIIAGKGVRYDEVEKVRKPESALWIVGGIGAIAGLVAFIAYCVPRECDRSSR